MKFKGILRLRLLVEQKTDRKGRNTTLSHVPSSFILSQIPPLQLYPSLLPSIALSYIMNFIDFFL
jgi:hypothetical protein